MEDDLLLESAEDILDEVFENDCEDITNTEENIDSSQELSEPDNQFVVDEELVEQFAQFLTTSSGVSDFMSETPQEVETESVDYTDILEDIYSVNVDTRSNTLLLQEQLSEDLSKPFENYTLTESFMFFTFVFVFVIFVFKTFFRGL